ncbi:hypothetical protein ATE84_3992 [Aquimarina sp. MAR_2010_214]|uniref:ATP-binding protein n=1 Tax=Aquimarina sp. MAR_2010_214 TaxID=1250026 RepID=UPI000C705707|nr:ATP-binding protein [Aquimarina sp. MAR_2010_214]PKV51892.1 hypothetical protein ATE84_3992 [Aquimarina sp. MAR_2010_214]
MRLVAVYILEHYLFEEPQVINIVGRYLYDITLEYKKIIINRIKNTEYVDNLHSNSITELSAIVGANGSGKTTIFSIINKDHDTTRAIFLYEDFNHEIKIVNRTGMLDENGNFTKRSQVPVYFNESKVHSVPNIDIQTLYYSPIPDEDLSNFGSSISKTYHFKSTLIDYHLDNIERSIMLMTDDVVDEIKRVYPELPLYNHISLSAKPLYKRDLRNTYGGFKIEGDIEKSQKEALEKLWESYPTNNEDKKHLTHDGLSFYRNIEINILSYLLIDSTSMETAFNGKYNISYYDIIKEEDFYEKLKHLFLHKIAYIDKYIYYYLKDLLTDYDYQSLLFHFESTNFDEKLKEKQSNLISLIRSYKLSARRLEKNEWNESFSESLDLLLNSEFEGEEFKNIRENLEKYHSHISIKIIENKKNILDYIITSLEKVEIGINKSFDAIFEARFEIIDQLKNGVKKAIKLFSAIQIFYTFTINFVEKEGVELIEGKINLNLRIINFNDFKNLIQKYKNVIEEFNGNSLINAQILEFRPDKRLSYGEKSLLNLFSSFYEFTIRKHHHFRRKEHYIILLDEADLGFHPLWKKKFVSAIAKIIPIIFEKLNANVDNSGNPELETRKTQIIISTHDPLTLSDIPNYNIVYIDRLKNGKSDVISILDDNYKPKQSFGANVHDLLAHSFFLKHGFMGEFAEEIITDLVNYLTFKEDEKVSDENVKYFREWDELKAEKVITIIDEPLIKERVQSLFIKKFLYNEKELLRLKIQELENQIARLDNEEN